MSYTPMPGTIPARVFEWLRGQPAGGMFAAAVIGDALEIESGQLPAYMKTALDHKAIVREKHDGRCYWGLPNTTVNAGPQAEIDEPDDAPIVQRVVPASPAPATPRPAAAPPGKPARKQVRKPRAGHAAPGSSTPDWQLRLNELERVAEPKPMRCAVWSDGALSIERAGQRMDLSVDESRSMLQMLRVVDRTLSGEGGA